MKRFFSLLAFLLLTLLAAPSFARTTTPSPFTDTIVVRLPNQAVMTLYVKNKEQLRQMRSYKLDSLMILLDTYITQAETAGKNSKSDQVTMEFYPAKDKPGKAMPEQIRVTVRNTKTPNNDHVEVHLGPSFGVVVDDNEDGDNVKVHVGRMDTSNRDSLRKVKAENKFNRPHHSNFSMDLGLNTLVNRNTPAPSTNTYDFALRPLGSRYISFQWRHSWRVGAKGSPVYIISGPEVAFNNYMFDNNARLFPGDSSVSIIGKESSLNLQKSKLATTTLNLPLMAQLYFRDQKGHESFRLSAGGFVGYRLSSHTKIKYDQDGSTKKDKDRGSYNLEDFQYGLQGVIGVRGVDLFVKYNLNDLFKENRGPQAQTLSFGISFL